MTDVQAPSSQPSPLPSPSAGCTWQGLLPHPVTEPLKILPLWMRPPLSRQHTPGHGTPTCRESQTAIQGTGGQDRGSPGRAGGGIPGLGEPAWFPLLSRTNPLGLWSYLYLRKKIICNIHERKALPTSDKP